jgi:hypothetical protein
MWEQVYLSHTESLRYVRGENINIDPIGIEQEEEEEE